MSQTDKEPLPFPIPLTRASKAAAEVLTEILEAAAPPPPPEPPDLEPPKPPEVRIHVATAGRGQAVPTYRRLQVSKQVADHFRSVVLQRLREIAKTGVQVRLYETHTSIPDDQVEFVDLEKEAQSDLAQQLAPLLAWRLRPAIQFRDKQMSGLRFYVISVHGLTPEPICAFRLFSPKRELTRSRFFGVVVGEDGFSEMQTKVLLFDDEVHCLSCDRYLFILRKDKYHQMFRLFDKVKKSASSTLAKVRKAVPIAYFSDLKRDSEKSLTMQTKLMSIASRFDGQTGITMDDYRRIIDEFELDIEIGEVGGQPALVYDPDKRWQFLRLLNDDYLHSNMTENDYEVLSKRKGRKRKARRQRSA